MLCSVCATAANTVSISYTTQQSTSKPSIDVNIVLNLQENWRTPLIFVVYSYSNAFSELIFRGP